MKYATALFISLLGLCHLSYANNFEHLKIEELMLLVREQQEKLAHKDKVIATQAAIVVALEQEVHHLKHEVRKESKYHELKKILKSLGF